MNYSAKYFKESLPEWKRKKDPILSRIFYRRVSFYVSSLAVKLNISANAISYFSAFIAIVACSTYLIDNQMLRICGAVLINVWLILDCADGNIARGVRGQPFGEFADAISSYLLVGLICTAIGFAAYSTGGIFVKSGTPWIILIGALASSSDSLMRLIYQKYNNTSKDLQAKGIIPIEYDVRKDTNSVENIRVRIESELGIGGILPIAILLGTIFNGLDLVVMYCFAYYGLSFMASTFMHIRKAIKLSCKPLH